MHRFQKDLKNRVPIHPVSFPAQSRFFFFHLMSRRPVSNVPLFMCSSVTLISIANLSVTDAILCNWHFYNDVNTPGGQSRKFHKLLVLLLDVFFPFMLVVF
jgi:hypothetical protein